MQDIRLFDSVLKKMGLALVLGVCWTSAPLAGYGQSLVAVDDMISLPNGGAILDARALLFGNDDVPTDSIQIVMVSSPTHGHLVSLGGHMFEYVADVGFIGQDSFQYQLQTVPIQHLTLDPAVSILEFDAFVTVDPLGRDGDVEPIPVGGTIDLDMGLDPSSVDSAQIVGLHLMNVANQSLRFDYGFPFTVGTLRIKVAEEKVRLDLVQPGPKATVTGLLNAFSQEDNPISVRVEATLDGDGVLASQVPDDVQVLETETPIALTGNILRQGESIVLLLTIDSDYAFDLDGNEVELNILGSIQAFGVFEPRIESNVATVSINVTEATDVEVNPLEPALIQLSVYPNPVVNEITVKVSNTAVSISEVSIIDVLGRIVQVQRFSGMDAQSAVRVNTSHLSSGVYLVNVDLPLGRVSRSIVVH
ncbi:MAG: T9SS type A sorting domain-containing protein [Bacteroidetes Order II. Incertae sedis bacterium]|jgi:hypothetical protein|nr:T9SS type A sorting domain-containing protein [Bacteroidetes Order II. bacterium]